MYQPDSDDSTKSSPKPLPKRAFGQVKTPGPEVIVDRPSHVVVNMNGTYAFAYESGSVSTYVTGSVVDDAAGPIMLEIQPVAWRQTNATGTVGDITFVYRGAL